jgi:hypothetical protein
LLLLQVATREQQLQVPDPLSTLPQLLQQQQQQGQTWCRPPLG